MHALEGTALPKELVSLLTPGTLFDVIRDTYARGKDAADKEALEQVISWGKVAEQMKMSEATREEILSTATRAHIRLGDFDGAGRVIEFMAKRSHRSVPFLRGHLYRRQEDYPKAIEMLVAAVREDKVNRSAVHELALAYKRSNRVNELRKLLQEHGNLVRDSATFADFQIGIDLARNDLTAAEAGIHRLRQMPDDDDRSDIREAQLLMKRRLYNPAKEMLGMLIANHSGNTLRLRSLRAMAASADLDFDLARRDIDFVRKFPSWQSVGAKLEATLLIEQGRPAAARTLLDGLARRSGEDWILYARALDTEADLPETPIHIRAELKARAAELRVQYNFALEYDVGDQTG
jgi:tetratricopeptide (TPR) repeat protein